MRAHLADEIISSTLRRARVEVQAGERKELYACVGLASSMAKHVEAVGVRRLLQFLDAIWAGFVTARWSPFDFEHEQISLEQAMGHISHLFRQVICRVYGIDTDELPVPLDEEAETTGDLVLYLRPLFDVGRYPVMGGWGDRYRLSWRSDWNEPRFVTFEHAINRVLRPPFRTVAFGGPYDPFGMARLFCFTEWRDLVTDYMRQASLILVYPSDTDGMRWEMQQLVDLGVLNRTAMVMMMKIDPGIDAEPYFEGDRTRIPERWEMARKTVKDLLNVQLPAYENQGAFLFLNDSGQVHHMLPLWTYLDCSFRDYVRARYGRKEALDKKYDPIRRK